MRGSGWCGKASPHSPAQLSFYVVKFLLTFCIIVAINANIERLRAGDGSLCRHLPSLALSLR